MLNAGLDGAIGGSVTVAVVVLVAVVINVVVLVAVVINVVGP